MITVNGYFKPEQWTAEDGTLKNRVIFVAVKFFATPDKEETPEKG
jgi:single-strand DNA-binding protein